MLFLPEYRLEWNGVIAKVVQADVECVNGVVHIIDKVMMMMINIDEVNSSYELFFDNELIFISYIYS